MRPRHEQRHAMRPTPVPAREQVTHFLSTSVWASLMATDLNVAPGRRGTVRVAFVAPWTDLTGSAQALTLLDRELRRAVTVWDTWTQPRLDASDETSDERAEAQFSKSLADALAAHPEPKRSLGELRVIAAEAEPFTVLLQPTGRLSELLCELPVSTLVYAMAAFGQDMQIRHYWHVDPFIGALSDGGDALRVLREASEERWPAERPVGEWRVDREGGRPSLFRAVAPPRSHRGNAYAIVHAEDPATDGTMAVVELLGTATSTLRLARSQHPRLL